MKDNSQAIAEEVKKVEDALDERTEVVNHISCSEFDIAKSSAAQEGASGKLSEPFHGVNIEFSGGNVAVTGKDEKFQQLDQQIQQSLANIEKANAGAQDQLATNTTDNANNASNKEALESEIKSKQTELQNQEAKVKELEAKNIEIDQQKQSKEGELSSLQETKQDLISNLNSDQISSIIQDHPDLQSVLTDQTNLAGANNESTDNPT